MLRLSYSRMKDFLVSPSYYHYRLENPKEATEAMVEGRAFHTLLLEGSDVFAQQYFDDKPLLELGSRKTKAYSSALDEIIGTRTLIKSERAEMIYKMVEAVRSDQECLDLLLGDVEKEILFDGDICPTKARLDVLGMDSIVEVKTVSGASDASPAGFAKACVNQGYDLQAAFYQRIVKESTGETLPVVFVVVAREEPFPVGIYTLDELSLVSAHETVQKAMESFARCLESNSWPSRRGGRQVISVPQWRKIDLIA